MRATVLTADYAQADDRGKINAIGLGWSTVPTPLPAHGVAIIIGIDWHQTNERHLFKLELLNGDGHPVALEGDESPVVYIEGEFEMGRPPGLLQGSELTQTVAFNFPQGMPLAAGGRYEYRVSVGDVSASASFTVLRPAF